MTVAEPFLPQEIIRAKRDGAVLDDASIERFVRGLTVGEVGEGQAAAFAMAVVFRGLSLTERLALTRAMQHSGTVLRWDLPGPVLDKHSTGGIGDAVSLVLAPAVAACGGFVPMISGRGLGHTGGTLDKLQAIPGYDCEPAIERFRRIVREVGCAIIGQTADLAPADRRLYAIRDVTATVESIDLITSSILCKKLAAGLDGLVLDVKCGSGAFMTHLEAARELANSLVEVGAGCGLAIAAVITDMHEPLASSAGNALEVAYAIDYLTGARREPRFHAVTAVLAKEMLRLGGLAADEAEAERRFDEALASGAAAQRFERMVAALGGPADLLARPGFYLAAAPVQRATFPDGPGLVRSIDSRAIGLAAVALGGGRTHPHATIDPAVGFTTLARIGERVDATRPLGIVHAADEAAAARAVAVLRRAYRLAGESDPAPVAPPVVLERLRASP